MMPLALDLKINLLHGVERPYGEKPEGRSRTLKTFPLGRAH